VEKQAQEAKVMLEAWGKAKMVGIVTALEEPVERPLWEAKNPPLSRRDLFVMLSRQGQVALARAIEKDAAHAERKAGRGRLRLNNAIAHLSEPQNGGVPLAEMGFAMLTVSESCTACGACARLCSTGALTFETNESDLHYGLCFMPRDCIACEACLHTCAEEAISLEHVPTAEQVWGPQETVLLRHRELTRCGRCNAWFAARSGVHLCPSCEFRQKNPFGSRLPPGVSLPGRSLS
jgi:ferredoxin